MIWLSQQITISAPWTTPTTRSLGKRLGAAGEPWKCRACAMPGAVLGLVKSSQGRHAISTPPTWSPSRLLHAYAKPAHLWRPNPTPPTPWSPGAPVQGGFPLTLPLTHSNACLWSVLSVAGSVSPCIRQTRSGERHPASICSSTDQYHPLWHILTFCILPSSMARPLSSAYWPLSHLPTVVLSLLFKAFCLSGTASCWFSPYLPGHLKTPSSPPLPAN